MLSNISLPNLRQVEPISELLARPCTIIAEDCTPTFPAIAAISGVKKNKIGYSVSALSNPLETFTAIKLPNNANKSQGNRAFVNTQMLSSASTSCEIPAANW